VPLLLTANINAKQSDKLLLEWEPKDHESRIVPLTEQTLKLLAEMQLSAPDEHPYIFINPERLRLIKRKEKKANGTQGVQLLTMSTEILM
jgi:integrase